MFRKALAVSGILLLVGFAAAGAVRQDEGKASLQAEYARQSRAYKQASRRIESLLNGYHKGLMQKEALREEWEMSARDCMDLIFDKEVFPNPPGPVSSPHIGYLEVMEEIDPMRELYSALREKTDKDLEVIVSMSMTRAVKLRNEFLQARQRMIDLNRRLEKGDSMEGPPAFPMAMMHLKCGDWKEAKEHNMKLAGYERTLFYFLYLRIVDDYNERVEAELSQRARSAVALNNDYRASLGLRPLQIHPKLVKAMQDHIETTKQMSHTGATPETRTLGQRVKRAGYKAKSLGENLANFDIMGAMEKWKWDGGHHRTLVHPWAVHIGPGEGNYSGMDVAAGEKPVIPSLAYIEH